MKKQLLALTTCAMFTCGTINAQRYLSEIFSSVDVTANVQYGSNISVFPPPTPASIPLIMDIYKPAGDIATDRALVIFMHTGSFLPRYINQTPTGSRNDSATVEICSRLARRGYVVANIDYRLGWNPQGSNVDIRRGTILNAIYRAVQDAKAAVRYCRANYTTLGVDTTKFILGGQGTGGYIAVNYAVLDDPAQITLPKFISGITDATYGFVAGQPYVNQAFLGDYDGYGGIPQLNNPNNSPGHDNSVQFVFNMGGAMGDSSWLEAGDAPMVAFHVVGDPFAPYYTGIVYVPGNPPQSVVDVSGSGHIIQLANALGNNDCFINAGFTDPFTLSANTVNGGLDGLYPFNFSAPFQVQAGPWEWFDSLTVVTGAAAVGQNGTTIYTNALVTNHDMSKAKAMAYIDTVMGYLNPRIVYCLNLGTGINEVAIDNGLSIAPNPSNDFFTVESLSKNLITQVELINVAGEQVMLQQNINAGKVKLSKSGLKSGMYFVRISINQKVITQKLVIQ